MLHSVTLQVARDAGATRPRQLKLRNGESAVFGTCACGNCDLDLVLGADDSSWLAGEVTATEGHWLLTNLGQSRTLLVENLENPYEYLTVAPGRRCAPVAFELSRVVAADSPDGPEVTVFGPEPGHVASPPDPCRATPQFRPPLDPDSTYFSVLQALCEPRMNGSCTRPLPTSQEIASGLGRRRTRLTPRAVDAHIEYVGDKLGLGRGIRRDVLVATAIRRGLLAVKVTVAVVLLASGGLAVDIASVPPPAYQSMVLGRPPTQRKVTSRARLAHFR